MKMRKITSFVLVLALVLGSFSMAFAATPATSAGLTDIAGVANEEAIQVNYDLGIITGNPDGTFLPTKAVNRAEFAAMITRALAVPASALAGYTSTTFKDTVGYGWAVPYLAFCQSKGIMIGDGFGNVMPGRTINVNEAMTMVLRTIGYTENSSMLVGTWPSKYVTVAQNLGLYDDVAAAVNVDKANAAQIIFNALTVQKVTVSSDGTTTYLNTGTGTEANPYVAVTLLNSGLGADTELNYLVDGDTYDVATINVAKYMGARGTAYFDGDDLVAFEKTSTALYGKYKSGSATKFTADGVDYNLPAMTTMAGITNASAAADITTLTAILASADSGKVTLNVKVSGKTISNIYSAVAWNSSEDDYIVAGDLKDITDDNMLFGDTFVSDDNDAIDVTQFELVGAANLAAIAKDDVVFVYSDNNTIRKVAVGTETISGRVTIEDAGDYTINGKVYSISTESSPTLAVGTEYDFDLDAYGDIYGATAISDTADMYGLVTTTAAGATALDVDRIELYLASDDEKVFTLDSDTTLPSATGVAIAYGLDKDGLVNELAVASTGTIATMTGIRTLNVSGAGTFVIAPDCVVFTLSSAKAWDISSVGNVVLNVDLTPVGGTFSYILNDDDEVAVMVVSSAQADRDADDVYGVINVVKSVWNATDEVTVNELDGIAEKADFVKMAIDSVVGDETAGAGLVKIVYDGDGFVKSATSTGITATAFKVFEQLNVAGDSVGTTASGVITWHDTTSDVIVYEAVYTGSGAFDYYQVSSLDDIEAGNYVIFYDTNTDAGYEFVIWTEEDVIS